MTAPAWRELGDEILGDLDEQISGVGWWAPHPGRSRRILISDHPCNCVPSVETNLIEARLHLIEAMDVWERESDFHARAVSITADRGLKVELPERRRPRDEITPAMAMLHCVGFIRAIAGALDCFGASVVGVTTLRANLLRADLDSARRALAAVAEQIGAKGPGFSSERRLRRSSSERIRRAGSAGWWT